MSFHPLESELGKLKAEHLGSDVERRRLERELEVKNDELKELTMQLGFSKDAEATAVMRYDKAIEYNTEVQTKLRESMAQYLPWNTERCRLEVKISELDDLVSELKSSKDAEAEAVEKYKQALEYNREVEAKLEDLRKGFNEERRELLGKLTETEAELTNLKEKLENKLKGNELVEIGGNLKPDLASERHVNDVKCSSKSRKRKQFAKPTVLSEGKLVGENGAAESGNNDVSSDPSNHNDDSSSDVGDQKQYAEKTKIQFFVETMFGMKITMIVKPSLTIGSLKSKIEDQLYISSPHQVLTFEGKQLEDGTTLAHYDIQKESIIYLTICLSPKISNK
ncbi:uncharacterized protein LOC141599123 [Silene latifolia]|uniref:uncharacterized protein LOC141599123 n=1 Tax=Silene latifolia TaxID=37657 RepID=UPI003D77DFA3